MVALGVRLLQLACEMAWPFTARAILTVSVEWVADMRVHCLIRWLASWMLSIVATHGSSVHFSCLHGDMHKHASFYVNDCHLSDRIIEAKSSRLIMFKV